MDEPIQKPEEGPNQIESFNLVVGLIFDRLYGDFPIKQRVDETYLGPRFEEVIQVPEVDERRGPVRKRTAGHRYVSYSNVPPKSYIMETLDWLVREGFLLRAGEAGYKAEYQLSVQTLNILGRAPEGLSENLGSQLSDVVRESGQEAGRAAIGEIVGQIIGAAARGAIGS